MADGPKRAKRGRPPAEAITQLIIEGHQSSHKVKCKYCQRTFPRDKSLTAHVRTHTGEKPFICTFPVPKCGKSFKQSGHLRTHERLHTDDYCFKCPVENCTMRFKHTNRSCSNHPNAKLVRETEPGYPDNLLTEEVLKTEHPDVIEWLKGYIQRFKNSRKTPDKRGGSKSSKKKQESCSNSSQVESFEQSYDLSDTSAQNLSVRDTYVNRREMQNSVLANIFASPVSQVGNAGEQSQVSSASSCVLDCSASTADCSFTNNLDCSTVSSPRKDQSLLTVNELDIACTPTRSTVFSTPAESPYLATPKSTTNHLNTNNDLSHFSTPGHSSYGTPLGRSTMYTSNESIRFSTPLDTKLHFPGLAPDFTSTPVGGHPETPDHAAPGSAPRSSCGPLRKNLTANKRIKSRRILGPLMEATHSRANANVTAPVGEPLDHRCLKSQVADENSYGQSDGVHKSIPSSPQHSRVFRNKQNQLLPNKKSDALLCLDMDGIKPISDEGLPYVYRDSLFSSNASYSLNDDRPPPFLHHHHSIKGTPKLEEHIAQSSDPTNCTYSRPEESHIPPKTARVSYSEFDPEVDVKVEPEFKEEDLDTVYKTEKHPSSIMKSSSCGPQVFPQEYPASSSASLLVHTESVSFPRELKTNSSTSFTSRREQDIFSPHCQQKRFSQLDKFSTLQMPGVTKEFSPLAHDEQKVSRNPPNFSQDFNSWQALSPVTRNYQAYGQHHQLQYADVKREVSEHSYNNVHDLHRESSTTERPYQLSKSCHELNAVKESVNSNQSEYASHNDRFDVASRAASCQRKLPFSQPASLSDVKLTGFNSLRSYYEPISPASPDFGSKNIDDTRMEHEGESRDIKSVCRANLNSLLASCTPEKLTSSHQSSMNEPYLNQYNTSNLENTKCQSSSETISNISEKVNSNDNYFKPDENTLSNNSKIVTAEPDSSSNHPVVGSLTVRTKAARKSYTPTKRFSAAMKTISPHKVYPKKRWMSRVNAQATKASNSCTWRSFNSILEKGETTIDGEDGVSNSGVRSDSTVSSGINFPSNMNRSLDEFESSLATQTIPLKSESSAFSSDTTDEVSSTVSSLGNTSFDDGGFAHITAAQVDITVTSDIGAHTNFHCDDYKSDSTVRGNELPFISSSLPLNEPLNLSTR